MHGWENMVYDFDKDIDVELLYNICKFSVKWSQIMRTFRAVSTFLGPLCKMLPPSLQIHTKSVSCSILFTCISASTIVLVKGKIEDFFQFLYSRGINPH